MQRRRVVGPYLAAVPPSIPGLEIHIDGELQALIEEAASELARFDAEVGHVAAPFAAILLRTESASSSGIENLTSGARQIALAELGEHASKNAQLVVGDGRAMQAALALSESIDGRAILECTARYRSKAAPALSAIGTISKCGSEEGASDPTPHSSSRPITSESPHPWTILSPLPIALTFLFLFRPQSPMPHSKQSIHSSMAMAESVEHLFRRGCVGAADAQCRRSSLRGFAPRHGSLFRCL